MDISCFTVKQSPTDNRDWIYSATTVNVPLEYDLRNLLQPIRNQGLHGSCFAMSACCMKEEQEKEDYNFNSYFSPKFFYSLRANLKDKNKSNDEGMFARDVMKILQNTGVCTEELCPYENVEVPISDEKKEELLENSKLHRIKQYARIYDLEKLKKALVENGVCLIAFPVYSPHKIDFWNKSDGFDKFVGGHAMCVVGYTQDAFIIRNSWGTKWGNNGYCYYNFSDWGKHWEVWTTVDDKSDIQIIVPEEEKKNSESDEPIATKTNRDKVSCFEKIKRFFVA